MSLDDSQLLRYSRHILLPELDIAGQEALLNSHVLIIGVGGLGNSAAQYLAASGIGTLTLADGDTVELSNLQRQILFSENDIGKNKAQVAKDALTHHPSSINTLEIFLSNTELDSAIQQADIVLDCTDNFKARSLINQYCIKHKIILISGAAIQWHGQIAIYDFQNTDSACYQCLYQSLGNEDLSCNQKGIAAPVVGIIGSIQALETLKVITQPGTTLFNKLLVFNGLEQQWKSFKISKNVNCPVCST